MVECVYMQLEHSGTSYNGWWNAFMHLEHSGTSYNGQWNTKVRFMHMYTSTLKSILYIPVGQWGDDQSPRVSQVLISVVEEGVCLSNSTVIILLQSTYASHNAVEQ